MSKNWPIKKLGEVCTLKTGGTPSRNHPEYFGGDIKWLVSGDINKKEIFDCEGRITELGSKESNAKLLPKDCVLIALNGQGKTRGTVAILRTEATCNQSLVAMIPNIVLLPEYLFHNLNWRYHEIRNITGATDRRGLSMKVIREIQIPVPPIEEQKRIVKKLEKILAKIEEAKNLRQKTIEESDSLLRGVLIKTFEELSKKYPKKEIKDFGDVKGGKRLPAGHTFASLPTEYPYLRVVDFKDYSIDASNMKYLGVATQQEISRYTINDKDLFISIAGTIGTVGVVPPMLSGANLTENAAKIVFKEENQANNKFLVYYLDSPQGKEEIKKRTNQVGQPKLALMRIETIEVPLPNIKEQEKIVAYLDSLSEKVQALQKLQEEQLQELERLKQSVLHQAFGG